TAATSGLTRKPTGAVTPIDAATADSISASATDSRLNWQRTGVRARRISSSVLPTPEKTILSGATPAATARRYSPPETTSAPSPALARVAITALLGLALTA